MPKPGTPVRPLAPQENILLAAAEEFAERGFAGARVDEIARRAGVNKAMLYYHVGDKAALYEQVILDAVATVTARIEEGLSKEPASEGKILAIARGFEAAATEKPYLPRIMMREMAMGGRNLPAPAIEAFAKIIRMETSILDEASRDGFFAATDPLTLHILIAGGTMLHLVTKGVRERIRGTALPGLPEPQGSAAEAVSRLLLQGLLARPGATGARDGESPRGEEASSRRRTKRSDALAKKEKRA